MSPQKMAAHLLLHQQDSTLSMFLIFLIVRDGYDDVCSKSAATVYIGIDASSGLAHWKGKGSDDAT